MVKKRTMIPSSKVDRLFASLIPIFLLLAVYEIFANSYYQASLSIAILLIAFLEAYLFQTPPNNSVNSKEFLRVIESLSGISDDIESLSDFLDKERKRVIEVESTIQKLNNEKQRLEPLVATQRSTIETILEEHSLQANKNKWKERILSFILGVFASIIASYVLAYIEKLN